MGDVRNINVKELPKIDLLIGGSPCQNLSKFTVAKNKTGLSGIKSSLFYEFIRILEECRPKYFLFENVTGHKKATEEISQLLSTSPNLINTNLFLPHNRARFYWSNIEYKIPTKCHSLELKDILESQVADKFFLNDKREKWVYEVVNGKKIYGSINLDPKYAKCLTLRGELSWKCNYITQNGKIRTLTPIEYERLQGIPDNYTANIPDWLRYQVIGNCWSVPVISHILKGIK